MCEKVNFGGAQDPFQLPPVVKEEEKRVLNEFYKSRLIFKFNSKRYREFKKSLEVCSP